MTKMYPRRRPSTLARAFAASLSLCAAVAGCGKSYSPDVYSTGAVQQANKVEQGVVVGVRQVDIRADGTTGAVTGGAAGGITGSQVATGVGSALSALGGSVIGGIVGGTVERQVDDTFGFEYVVRKANGELVSVTQKDATPLPLGQHVLVIAGNQARIVVDYTVPLEAAPAATPAAPAPAAAATTPAPTPATPPTAVAPSTDAPAPETNP